MFVKLAPARLVIALQTQVYGHRDPVFDLESRPDHLRLLQTAHNQSGGDEQQKGKSHLRDDQPVAETRTAITAESGLILQRRDKIDLARLQRRRQTEERAGNE